jgi:hypothetical protein
MHAQILPNGACARRLITNEISAPIALGLLHRNSENAAAKSDYPWKTSLTLSRGHEALRPDGELKAFMTRKYEDESIEREVCSKEEERSLCGRAVD